MDHWHRKSFALSAMNQLLYCMQSLSIKQGMKYTMADSHGVNITFLGSEKNLDTT
jgi:hypothetical protein